MWIDDVVLAISISKIVSIVPMRAAACFQRRSTDDRRTFVLGYALYNSNSRIWNLE